nr:MAG TPA: hypothetical protein [Caudoviricetes sp.]
MRTSHSADDASRPALRRDRFPSAGTNRSDFRCEMNGDKSKYTAR